MNKNILSLALSHISKIALTSIFIEDSQYNAMRSYSIAEYALGLWFFQNLHAL